jgi:hypothetical protein
MAADRSENAALSAMHRFTLLSRALAAALQKITRLFESTNLDDLMPISTELMTKRDRSHNLHIDSIDILSWSRWLPGPFRAGRGVRWAGALTAWPTPPGCFVFGRRCGVG